MPGWEIVLYVLISLAILALFVLGRGSRIFARLRGAIRFKPKVVEPRAGRTPPVLQPSPDLPGYKRVSTANMHVLRYLAKVAGPDQPGVSADQIMLECLIPRHRQAHLALSLKDAMAEGLVVNTAPKGDQYRYALTHEGVKVALQ